jgi:hypothetical protein
VITQEDIKVVREGENLLLQEVHRRERFAPDVDVSLSIPDLNEGERLVKVCISVVLHVLVAENQLVGVVISECAVQLQRNIVGRVGEDLVVAGEIERCLAGRKSGEGVDVSGVRIVVPGAEPVILVDVPVELPEELVAVQGRGYAPQASGIVPIPNRLVDETQELIEIGLRLDGRSSVAPLPLKSGVKRLRRLFPVDVEIGEEEQLVLDDGPAQAPHVPVVIKLRERSIREVLGQVFIAVLNGEGALELVGAASRDGVDGPTAEIALSDVVGRHLNVELLNRVDANRRGAGLSAVGALGREAEHVVTHRPVDEDRIVPVVLPGNRDRGAIVIVVAHDGLRRKPRKVGDRAVNGRGRLDLLLGNVG